MHAKKRLKTRGHSVKGKSGRKKKQEREKVKPFHDRFWTYKLDGRRLAVHKGGEREKKEEKESKVL